MGLIQALIGIVRNTYVAYKEASSEAKISTGFSTAKCHYITDQGAWEMSGHFSKDRMFFKPKGIDRLFKVCGKYPFNGSETIIYCYDKTVETVRLGDLPKLLPADLKEKLERKREETLESLKSLENLDKREKALESLSFADYSIKGADKLSGFAQDLMDNVDLRFIQGVSRSKVILLLIIGVLIGFIMGSVGGSVIVLALMSGG